MKTFYGMLTELYEDDTFKASLISGTYKEKPFSDMGSCDGVTIYWDWYDTEALAKQAVKVKNKIAEKKQKEKTRIRVGG